MARITENSKFDEIMKSINDESWMSQFLDRLLRFLRIRMDRITEIKSELTQMIQKTNYSTKTTLNSIMKKINAEIREPKDNTEEKSERIFEVTKQILIICNTLQDSIAQSDVFKIFWARVAKLLVKFIIDSCGDDCAPEFFRKMFHEKITDYAQLKHQQPPTSNVIADATTGTKSWWGMKKLFTGYDIGSDILVLDRCGDSHSTVFIKKILLDLGLGAKEISAQKDTAGNFILNIIFMLVGHRAGEMDGSILGTDPQTNNHYIYILLSTSRYNEELVTNLKSQYPANFEHTPGYYNIIYVDSTDGLMMVSVDWNARTIKSITEAIAEHKKYILTK